MMLEFTLYQQNGDADPGDLLLDPTGIESVITGEQIDGKKQTVKIATIHIGQNIYVVRDENRTAMQRVLDAKGELRGDEDEPDTIPFQPRKRKP